MTFENYRFPVRLGGDISLDFTNTAEYRGGAHYINTLHSYRHVVEWCYAGGVIDAAERDRLVTLAGQHATAAAAAYQNALDLREALYHIFTAAIAKEQPLTDDLARLNATLRAAIRRIQPAGEGFVWVWEQSDDLAQVIQPLALAAANLLTSEQLQRIRQCPNCGWLFVDTSRNHSRRWCSMDFCGSKVKSRRQYERRKGVQTK